MSARILVLITSFAVGISLCVVGVVGTAGYVRLSGFRNDGNPKMDYETSIRLPSPPPPPPDRSQEGPEFGTLMHGSAKPSNVFTGSWSRFRGDHYDAIAVDSPPLTRSFPPGGPPELWSLELGEGYAAASVKNGKAFILDYDLLLRRDVLRCLNVESGEEIWNFSYPVMISRNHGVSRTIPAVSENHCVAFGPLCHVFCVDPDSGELKWSRNLVREYGTVVPQWYAGQCPLIVEFPGENSEDSSREVAILAPSGTEALMLALDCETGEEIWRTPNPFGWVMTHTSVFPMDLYGKKTFVYVGKGGVVGVEALTGEILWSNHQWKIGIATCPSPLILPGHRIFLCGGYESPCAMLQIRDHGETPDSDRFEATVLYTQRMSLFGSEQQTPLFFEDCIFGLRQRDRRFVCLDPETGKENWRSGTKADFGSRAAGPYLIADGLFIFLSDEGMLIFAEATKEEFRFVGSWEVFPEGNEAWGPLTFFDGLLIVRDLTRMRCLDLRK